MYLWVLQRVLHKLADVMQHCLDASQIGVAHSAGLCIAAGTHRLGHWETFEMEDAYYTCDCGMARLRSGHTSACELACAGGGQVHRCGVALTFDGR